nr:alpha-glucosidase C-terminal domain-containing protein [Thermodesulfobacteriota bacterium]
MNKNKNRSQIIIRILGIFLFSIFLIGWKSQEKTIIEIGTIKYIWLEGGFYGIITDKGGKYLPVNLPEEFKKDGLRVWFKARPKKIVTIYQWGEPVEILEIKLIEKIQNLSQIKVTILYERITDGIYHPSKIRTYKDLVKILKETNPDLVFRIWWRWTPIPESLPSNTFIYQAGYTYQQLEETLRKLKKDLPEIKYWFGAIPTQRINFKERNPITGKIYSQRETWQMALDPQKWGINFSKERFQRLVQKRGTGRYGYFPDVTNREFQKLYLSWAKRQIDAGVNGLFLDMLFAQPRFLAKITKNFKHRAVKESLKAIGYLIKEIRMYGYKKGKYIYLCSFGTFTDFPDYKPDLDFVVITPTVEEIRDLTLNEKRWDEIVSKIKERLPKAKILAMIDWGGTTNTPLGVFSQELSKEEQREFLKIADEFFSKKGIIFVYPVHGGFMGQDARILSFGKLKTYDSLAPEFQTYETIKELIQSKRTELICTDRIDNDGDGLIDNEDGDCWIKDGAILGEEYYVATKYLDYIKIIPELKDIGIKTIEMFPIWEHCNSPDPTKRWAVRDFNKLDPQRGTEEELRLFLKTAHKYNIKVITMLSEWASAFPSTPECKYFDSTGDGGALYHYQIENPDKNILIKDKSGNFICHCCGYGYAPDPTSQDVIDFFLEQYKKIQDYGFDGLRLDASAEFTCKKDEKINTCPYKLEEKPCPEPVEKDYPLQDYYRDLSKLKKPGEVWHAESASVKRVKIPVEKNPLCRFPFYYPNTTNDEYAEISSSHFNMILPYLFRGKINSADFVKLLKKEPIAYNRTRLRGVIKKDIGEVLTKESMNFVVNDPRYYPSVVLVSTIPGVPYVGVYELFGSRLADKLHGISGDSVATAPKRRAFWKKVLNIRNRSDALKYGTIENVWKSGDNTYAYLREYKNEKVVVVINFLNKRAVSTLNLSFLTKGTILYDELNNEKFIVDDPSNFKISLPAYSSRILILKTTR